MNYQKRTFESDNTEVEYDGEDDAAPGDVTAINLQHRKYEIERKRIGANSTSTGARTRTASTTCVRCTASSMMPKPASG